MKHMIFLRSIFLPAVAVAANYPLIRLAEIDVTGDFPVQIAAVSAGVYIVVPIGNLDTTYIFLYEFPVVEQAISTGIVSSGKPLNAPVLPNIASLNDEVYVFGPDSSPVTTSKYLIRNQKMSDGSTLPVKKSLNHGSTIKIVTCLTDDGGILELMPYNNLIYYDRYDSHLTILHGKDLISGSDVKRIRQNGLLAIGVYNTPEIWAPLKISDPSTYNHAWGANCINQKLVDAYPVRGSSNKVTLLCSGTNNRLWVYQFFLNGTKISSKIIPTSYLNPDTDEKLNLIFKVSEGNFRAIVVWDSVTLEEIYNIPVIQPIAMDTSKSLISANLIQTSIQYEQQIAYISLRVIKAGYGTGPNGDTYLSTGFFVLGYNLNGTSSSPTTRYSSTKATQTKNIESAKPAIESSETNMIIIATAVAVSLVAVAVLNVFAVKYRRRTQETDEAKKAETSSTFSTIHTQMGESVIAVPGYLEVDPDSDFRFMKTLTAGGAGQIDLVSVLNEDLKARIRTDVVISKSVIKPKPYSERDRIIFLQELSLLHFLNLHSQSFAQLYAFNRPRMIMYLKFYQCGSMSQWIRSVNSSIPFSRKYMVQFFKDICTGLHLMHENDFVHCDLKPDNILIDDRNGTYHAVITDLGISRILNQQHIVHDFKSIELRGLSFVYAAPEVILEYRLNASNLSSESHIKSRDIYSIACMLCETFTRKSPWK